MIEFITGAGLAWAVLSFIYVTAVRNMRVDLNTMYQLGKKHGRREQALECMIAVTNAQMEKDDDEVASV